MNKMACLLPLAVALLPLSPLALAASDSGTSGSQPPARHNPSAETERQAARMMAHLSFAAQAIDLGLRDEALSNLTEAGRIAARLKPSSAEELANGDYRYGKTRVAVGGTERSYYVPVDDEVYIEGRFNEKAMERKNPKVEVKSVTLVHSNLKLNLAEVQSSISAAEASVRQRRFDEARDDLGGVFKNALASQEAVTDPGWAAWSDLVLADEFYRTGQYKSARFAMNEAKEDLDRLQKQQRGHDNGELRSLQAELEKTERTLGSQTKRTAKQIEAKLSDWAHRVRAWL